MNERRAPERVATSRRGRDVSAVMRGVPSGDRTQVEAARLLRKSVRPVRRRQRRMEADGDAAVVHGLRGRPSNYRRAATPRARVLRACRATRLGVGPTFAVEKLAGDGRTVGAETLRRGLPADGRWGRKRHPRRSCSGEPVRVDASIRDWLGGRGETAVPIAAIDDATGRRPTRTSRPSSGGRCGNGSARGPRAKGRVERSFGTGG